ncbi:MAG: hypothetical protein R3E97_10620 [Candidatus Eisenbacteria bacterium]
MHLDFGVHEPLVRWIEESDSNGFWNAAVQRVSKRPQDRDALLLAGALASARAVDPARSPSWFLQLTSTYASLHDPAHTGEAGDGADGDLPVLRFLSGVRESCDRFPFRLPQLKGPSEGAKEDLTYAFLEAVHKGDADAADERFSSLAADLGKDEAGDLLFSSGLEALTGPEDTLLGAVEALTALQQIGWEWGPILLRPVVRQQASPAGRSDLYDRACREIATRQLLRRVRRRTPGVPSLGETEPQEFLERSLAWSQAEPVGRMEQMADMLARGISLEDAGEVVSLASTLLFLQEGLRRTPWTVGEIEERISVVAGARAVRRLLHLATPGQRILGLLLAGIHPGLRDVRLRPEAPECGWWLSPATRWTESAPAGNGSGETPAMPTGGTEAWEQALAGRTANALLPIVEGILESGGVAQGLRGPTAAVARRQNAGYGRAIALERVLADAYDSTRAPHRWIHVWASGVAQCLWPLDQGVKIVGLQGSEPVC